MNRPKTYTSAEFRAMFLGEEGTMVKVPSDESTDKCAWTFEDPSDDGNVISISRHSLLWTMAHELLRMGQRNPLLHRGPVMLWMMWIQDEYSWLSTDGVERSTVVDAFPVTVRRSGQNVTIAWTETGPRGGLGKKYEFHSPPLQQDMVIVLDECVRSAEGQFQRRQDHLLGINRWRRIAGLAISMVSDVQKEQDIHWETSESDTEEEEDIPSETSESDTEEEEEEEDIPSETSESDTEEEEEESSSDSELDEEDLGLPGLNDSLRMLDQAGSWAHFVYEMKRAERVLHMPLDLLTEMAEECQQDKCHLAFQRCIKPGFAVDAACSMDQIQKRCVDVISPRIMQLCLVQRISHQLVHKVGRNPFLRTGKVELLCVWRSIYLDPPPEHVDASSLCLDVFRAADAVKVSWCEVMEKATKFKSEQVTIHPQTGAVSEDQLYHVLRESMRSLKRQIVDKHFEDSDDVILYGLALYTKL